ncbi:hypothetical protein CW713_00340, partial [Methanophagales archaeon]
HIAPDKLIVAENHTVRVWVKNIGSAVAADFDVALFINTSIVASIYPADKKDFRLNPYRVFGVNKAEPRYR